MLLYTNHIQYQNHLSNHPTNWSNYNESHKSAWPKLTTYGVFYLWSALHYVGGRIFQTPIAPERPAVIDAF